MRHRCFRLFDHIWSIRDLDLLTLKFNRFIFSFKCTNVLNLVKLPKPNIVHKVTGRTRHTGKRPENNASSTSRRHKTFTALLTLQFLPRSVIGRQRFDDVSHSALNVARCHLFWTYRTK